MADKTAIQWCDTTWNPVTGCTRVSEGCRNCYIERTPAFRMAGRKFVNGKTGVKLHRDRLDTPYHWKNPRMVFVNSLSDLFHEDIPDDFIEEVFTVMWGNDHHVFQILTKRPERMRDFVTGHIKRWGGPEKVSGDISHIWLGVSVEDQKTADERIPILLQTPAAIRWISAEPLLEEVGIADYPELDWVVVGGESGPKARPCDLGWIRRLVYECGQSMTACFVKQLGADPVHWVTKSPAERRLEDYRIRDKKGGDPQEWPEDLRVREYP